MSNFKHFCKCTPQMYSSPFQISKYATEYVRGNTGWPKKFGTIFSVSLNLTKY